MRSQILTAQVYHSRKKQTRDQIEFIGGCDGCRSEGREGRKEEGRRKDHVSAYLMFDAPSTRVLSIMQVGIGFEC